MTLPPLALKAIAAAVVTTPIVGVGIAYREEISASLSGKTITKWDKWLKDAIGHTSSNLNFTLAQGANSETVSTFPNFSTATNDANSEASITFKVTADSTHSLPGATGDTLQKKNKKSTDKDGAGTAWTWECTIKLIKKDKKSTKVLEDTVKNKIYQSNNLGALGKITVANNKDLKKKLVDLCAKERGSMNNYRLDTNETLTDLSTVYKGSGLENNKVKSTKVFWLKDGSNNNLEFEDKKGFKEWFEESSTTT